MDSQHDKPLSEDELIESGTGFFRVILDNLPVAIFAKDASNDYRFVLWNKKQEEITTISPEKALNHTDYELFSRESAQYFREFDEAIVARGKQLEIPQEVIETSPGNETYLRTFKVPVTKDGRTILVGISEDITERVKNREQMETLNRDLVSKNEELESIQMQLIQAEKLESIGRLAAGVAHEVKNPLTLLLQGVEYLSGGIEPGDPNIDIILTEMKNAIERADKIVKGLVDFSSNHQMRKQSVCPIDLMERVLLMIRHEINRNSVKITRIFDADSGVVCVDESRFEQVLINLLMNAIHAMANTEAPELKITIRTSTAEVERDEGTRTSDHLRSGDQLTVFEIEDNGSGIDEANLGKLFDPFFTTKATGVGTGLGLSVVRKIVQLHKGDITLNNRQDGLTGVKTKIRLPSAE